MDKEFVTLTSGRSELPRLARHPHYVPLEASMDAGLTEVEDDDAVALR